MPRLLDDLIAFEVHWDDVGRRSGMCIVVGSVESMSSWLVSSCKFSGQWLGVMFQLW